MGDKNETTSAGRYLTERMKALGFKTKADLADTAGVSRSTITRLYSNPDYRPDIHNLRRLATALRVEPDDLTAAIYGEQPPAEPPELHPLAAELDRMLAGDSQLTLDSRMVVEKLVDRALEPSRREMRTRATGTTTWMLAVHETPAESRVPAQPAESGDGESLPHKLERLGMFADMLDQHDRSRLGHTLDMLIEWADGRVNSQPLNDDERAALRRFQETIAAVNEAQLRERPMREKPAERR